MNRAPRLSPYDPAQAEAWMRRALELARAALAQNEVPVGAIVVDAQGHEIAAACDARQSAADPLAHAEVLALRAAAAAQGDWRLDGMTLVVTLEPCPMCAGAILMSRIGRVVFGAKSDKWGAAGTRADWLGTGVFPHKPEVISGVMAEEAAALLGEYFKGLRRYSSELKPVIKIQPSESTISISDLWDSSDAAEWEQALQRYWSFVQPRNLELERNLETLELNRIRGLDAEGWFEFLRDEYFRWKYTAPNRYASTTRQLARYQDENSLDELDKIRQALLCIDQHDVQGSLNLACSIHGLGTAGASGLLALMYPQTFATVDQFVVKALGQVRQLPEAESIARMSPESLSVKDGVMLISILQKKAASINRELNTSMWSPRKLDKVLWTYGR